MKKSSPATIALNKQALHEYEVLERFDAGLKLLGTEVKAIRQGTVQLKGSYVVARTISGVPTLQVINMHIGVYKPAGLMQHLPTRPRDLLVKAKEFEHIVRSLEVEGQAAVPLELHFAHGLVKLTVALARGKKLHDKRRTQKEREVKRTINRALRQR